MEWATMDVFREHIYKDRWLLNHLGTGKPTNFREGIEQEDIEQQVRRSDHQGHHARQ